MRHESLDDHWHYNCEDCCRTYECAEVERDIITQMNLGEQEAAQQSMFMPILKAMLRGVRIDLAERSRFAGELLEELSKREQYFIDVLGHPLNPKSPKQMQALFYDDLRQKQIISRATGNPTLDDEALTTLGSREPLLLPLLRRISEHRSMGVFLSTFVNAPLDYDGRMRCSFNPCGTESFRLSSSKNAFGSGMNMQNIPKGDSSLDLPNVRRLFIPDDGYTFFDIDLDRADLQVVVWEADDKDLKLALRAGLDMHLFNACYAFNIKGVPLDELKESHPNYREHRQRIGESKRQIAKTAVHAVDYGCKARTLAIHLGSTVREAEKFIDGWFGAHPGIRQWHERIDTQLQRHRSVRNQYGYKRIYFDRTDNLLPEALAWIPQSTVALTINRHWIAISEAVPELDILGQVHDSLFGEYPTRLEPTVKARIIEACQTPIPYADPLIIPVGLKTSTKSWGDCK